MNTKIEISESAMRAALAEIKTLAPGATVEFQIEISQRAVSTIPDYEKSGLTDEQIEQLAKPLFSICGKLEIFGKTIYGFSKTSDLAEVLEDLKKEIPTPEAIEKRRQAGELRKQADAIEQGIRIA